MDSMDLHQRGHNLAMRPRSNGNHPQGDGGWIVLQWGDVEVALHYEDADLLRDEIRLLERQLDENIDRRDRPEMPRTEVEDQRWTIVQ